MGLQAWIARLTRAMDSEYERRIKRASNVVAYGAHAHEHDQPVDEADDGAEIVNLVPGTPVRSSLHHELAHAPKSEVLAPLSQDDIPATTSSIAPPEDENEAQEAEIVNLPRGAPVRSVNES